MKVKGMLAFALATALFAVTMTASAFAAQGLVVQQREAGTQLLAHRYAAGPTGAQKLTVVVKPNTDFKTVTLLDFDRDGQPDGMVNMYWNAPTQNVTWQLWKYTKRPLADGLGTGAGPCFVPGLSKYAYNSPINPGAHNVALDKRSGSWSVTATADFDREFGDLARYQPRMVTFYTTSANALGGSSMTATDYLPNSAEPSAAPADTGCMGRSPDEPSSASYLYGFKVSPDGWTDRGQGVKPPKYRQTMLDAEDPGAESDLVEANVEQFEASQQTGDVTSTTADSTAPSLGIFHPMDLVLRFKGTGSGGIASATYLFANNGTGPSGLILTNPVPDQPGKIAVELHYDLTGLTGSRCYPRSGQAKLPNGADWGPAPYRLTLPLTTDANGRKVVRVALDHQLGIFQQASGDVDRFRWVAAGVPGGAGPPDYLPEITAASASTCVFSDNSYGTTLDPSKTVRMSPSVPTDLTLTPSKVNPTTSEAITLSAGSTIATHFQFQPYGTGAFDTDTLASTRTGLVYGSAATARVYAWANDGAAQMADARVVPANTPPSPAWFYTGQLAPFVLDPTNGVTIVWNDDSHDPDATPVIARRAWTLTQVSTGKQYFGTAQVFSHTFNVGDQGDWKVELTATDDEGDSRTKTETIRIIQPPIAIIEKITPCPGNGTPGAGPDGCVDEVGPIVWDPYAGGRYKVWARTATDGSLGSEGPLDYYFMWYDQSTWSLWTVPYASSFTVWPGAYQVKMKVRDKDGRESAITTRSFNVRAPGDTPPTAAVTVTPAQPVSGSAVLLDASASVLNNPDGTTEKAFKFRYDFGDGTAPLVTDQDAVTHVYAGSGAYTATVVAIDHRSFANATESDPVTATIQVGAGETDVNAPKPALERLSPAGKVYADRDVTFSAAATTVKTAPATYAWDLDGDGTYETDGGTQAVLTTKYATAGHRDVRVRVTDGAGRAAVSTALGIDVAAAPVLAPTVVLSGPDTVDMGSDGVARAALDATGSKGNNDDPTLTYAWDLDADGTFETGTGTTPKAQARLLFGGDQTVRVLATDAFGNTAIASKTIFVRSAADIAAGCTGKQQYRGNIYKVVRVYGCWTSVSRPNAGPLWIAHGDVSLNGLRLQSGSNGRAKDQTFADCSSTACQAAQRAFNDEGQGRQFMLDQRDGHFASNAPVAIRATGSGVNLTLNDAPLDTILPESKDDDGLMLSPPGGTKFLTLDLASSAEVTFPALGQAASTMTVRLPPQMPGAGGEVTLRSTETQGLILDKLRIEVQSGLLSEYLKLGRLAIEYDRPEDQWTGEAELGLPAIKGKSFEIEVQVVIKNGGFKSIYGAVGGINQHLGEGIFLQRIRAGVGVNPLDLQGGIGISAGPKIGGIALLAADGDFRVTFPSSQYPFTLFQVSGGTKLFDAFDLERGVVRFATNGFFEARYGYSRDVGIAYFDADIGGWFTFDKANFTGNAEAGIKFLGDRVKLIGAKAVLSTRGIAACGEIPVIELGGGVGYRWGDEFNVFEGCDLGPYSEARPAGIPEGFSVRAAAAATRLPTVDLPAGLRSAGITVQGRGGVPRVTVVDADGTTVLDATKESLTEKSMVVFDADHQLTSILWKAPPKGKYFVVAEEGSPAVAKVRKAVDAGPQKVKATVTGTGAKRQVRWSVTPKLQKGQELVLGEAVALDGAGTDIVTTTKSSGTVRFAPEDGHGERRVVTATIVTNGLGRPTTVAGQFAAPKLARPARPARVTLTRSGRKVKVAWAPAKGSAPATGGWRVTLKAGELRAKQSIIATKKRSVTFTDIPVGVAVSADVAGLTASRMAGTARKVTLAAGAARSGASTGAAAAKPRGVTAKRSGKNLVVRWRAAAAKVRGYAVVVRVGKGKALRLTTSARRPTVTVAGLPKKKTAVRVEVRGLRLTGGLSPAVVVAGRR